MCVQEKAHSASRLSIAQVVEQLPDRQDIAAHVTLLQRCRREGIEVGYRNLGRPDQAASDLDPAIAQLLRTLIEWLLTPTWAASKMFLTEHAGALLNDQAETLLTTLAQQQPDQAVFADHLVVLHTARSKGIEAAFTNRN